MGAAVIGVIAASAARADADLLERFRVADATALNRAQPLDQLGVSASSALTRYIAVEVIRSADGNRYYLDEAALAAFRRRGVAPRLVAALGVAVLVFVGILFMLVARR